MDKKERASVVQEELMRLYENPPIPLTHHDPYTLLVAVLLSAQCTDKRVNLVTPALFALASTPEEMARQDVEAVERDLKALYPQNTWGDLHLRIVLYGREYCPARGCGGSCPICSRLNRTEGFTDV